jgi:single-strand DNA-binding protein
MNLNKAMIIGNLTRDPEMKTTPNGQAVASFSVATNFIWNDQSGQKKERVEFHNIVAWRRLAEICGQYLRKGSKIYVEGRLQTRDWAGQDGVKRYRTEIIAENLIMLDRQGGGSAPMGGGASMADDGFMPAGDPSMMDDSAGDDEIKVENIPF